MKITDEMLEDTAKVQAAAPDIIAAAEASLALRSSADPHAVLEALLAAAWMRHKQIAGPDNPDPFINKLRRWADSIERMQRPN